MDYTETAIGFIEKSTLNENILRLARYGWYIPAKVKFRTVFDPVQLFAASQNVAAENILTLFFGKNMKGIENFLVEEFPKRSALLKEAFLMHKKKHFGSSVLLFLSQAEGICRDRIVLQNFSNNPELNENRQIRSLLGIEGSEDKSGFFSSEYRERVRSGMINDFATETASLKALSLLCFITDFTVCFSGERQPTQ